MTTRIIRSSVSLLAVAGELCRAPKKKGQAEAKIESEDIVNIFKGLSDPELRPIRFYPLFVHQYAQTKYPVYEHNEMIREGIPQASFLPTEHSRYLKGLKKMQTKQSTYIKRNIIKMKLDEQSDQDIYSRWHIDDPTDVAEEEVEEEVEEEDDEDEEEEGKGKPQGRRREQ